MANFMNMVILAKMEDADNDRWPYRLWMAILAEMAMWLKLHFLVEMVILVEMAVLVDDDVGGDGGGGDDGE